jgi:hypothetical protein
LPLQVWKRHPVVFSVAAQKTFPKTFSQKKLPPRHEVNMEGMKPKNWTHRMPKVALATLVLLAACKRKENASDEQRAWYRYENPETLNLPQPSGQAKPYEYQVEKLPEMGELPPERKPWADTYWPTVQTGIGARWNLGDPTKLTFEQIRAYSFLEPAAAVGLTLEQLAELSPAEKYDLYLGSTNFDLAKYMRAKYEWRREGSKAAYIELKEEELKQLNLPRDLFEKRMAEIRVDSRNVDVLAWEGLCHGWAAASLMFEEPRPVIAKSFNPKTGQFDGKEIPFGSSDIKALLAYYVGALYGNNGFVGRTCAKEIKPNEKPVAGSPQALSTCERLNAGSFHIILANMIGLQKIGFIANMTSDLSEMWNHPVFKYKTEFVGGKTKLPLSANAAKGPSPETTADFQYQVRTTVWFRKESVPTWLPQGNDARTVESRTYDYTLEIDESTGRILGGEWISQNAPDFLWVQTKPSFVKQAGPGAALQNYLSFVESLYAQGLNNPFQRDLTKR